MKLTSLDMKFYGDTPSGQTVLHTDTGTGLVYKFNEDESRQIFALATQLYNLRRKEELQKLLGEPATMPNLLEAPKADEAEFVEVPF